MLLPRSCAAAPQWFEVAVHRLEKHLENNERRISRCEASSHDPVSKTEDPPAPKPDASPPIKLPDPPEEKQPEIPKVGSRDAPGG